VARNEVKKLRHETGWFILYGEAEKSEKEVITIVICFRHVFGLRMMKQPENLEYYVEETSAYCR
jgi:hypothetical protein